MLQAQFLHCRPAADKGAGFGPACALKLIRHTGACAFACSGTVGDQPGIFGQPKLSGPLGYMVGRHTHGPLGQPLVAAK